MKKHTRFTLLPLIFALAIMAAFVLTAPVYAQDETPADPVPVEEPVTEEVPEEVPSDELAPALEEAAEAGVTLVDESGEPLALASEEAAEALAGGDPYYKVGTTTYNFTFADCDPGTVGNQACPNPIVAAVNYITTTGLPSDGFIYVEAGTYPDLVTVDATAVGSIYNGFKGLIGTVVDGEPKVELNGYIYVNSVESGFTIKGFDVNANWANGGIFFVNSKGTIKIEDVIANNASTGYGIGISNHDGAIILNRVVANNNINGGAIMNNTAGTAGVTITNSSFDYNNAHANLPLSGLTIFTKGAVSIDGITASHNTGGYPGLFIGQSGTITIKNGVLNNNEGFGFTNDYSSAPTTGFVPASAITLTNVFASSNYAGMDLYTKGNITLTGVHADSNIAGQGASLMTCYENTTGACTWLGTGMVTIKDSSFNGNNGFTAGLWMQTRGAVSITNSTVDGTTDLAVNPFGAILDSHYSQLASAVTITNSSFSNNDNTGLQVQTKGVITLTKVKANNNLAGYGAELINVTDAVPSAVTVTGSLLSDNQFNDNGLSGLDILSNGAVTVKYADGSGNGGSGLAVFNTAGTGSVSVSKSTFGWWADGNTDSGIGITTKGNVTISDVTATGYGHDGLHVFIDSTLNSTATITNSSFHMNGLNGLDIEGRGTITLSKVYASDNPNLGAELAAYKVGNIIVKDSNFDYNGDHPYDYGLYAYTAQGTITLTNVSVCYTVGTGAYLTNSGATTAKAVSITGGNFNNNTRTGLQVYSKGAITLKNVNAYGNNESNIDASQDQRTVREVIDAHETDAMTFQSISGTVNNLTVTAVAFTPEMWLTGCTADATHYWDSNYDGIVEHDYGAVAGVCTLHIEDHFIGTEDAKGGAYEVWMGGTYDATKDTYGAYLDNTAGTAGITIANNAIPASDGPLGYLRDFSLNTAGGLILHTKGAVSLSNLVLDDNGGYGVLVSNEDGEATHATNVTMTGIYANENYYSGIWVVNKGSITLTNVASWGHMTTGTGYGAYLDNDASTGSITIKNTIAMPFGFDYNHERGLNIFTNGKVSVTNVQMVGNDEDGIRVWAGATGPTGVTLTNCVMNDNVGYGASIRSFGPIVVTGSTFNDNAIAAHFVNLDSTAATPKPITLSKVTAEDNPAGGIEIDSYGAVSLTDVTVEDSSNVGIVGIDIDNYQGPYGVTLTRVNSNYSGGVGIFVVTNGALTYKGGEVKSNGSDGISVYAGLEAMVKTVILSDLYIYNNDGYGASIYNQGAITLTNVRSSSNNGGWGMWLDNTACGTATPCAISILQSGTGVNEFNYNDGGGGLKIDTYGVVVVNKASASWNEDAGLSIVNNEALPSKPVNVTITGGTFEQNDGNGLYVRSRGVITVSGVTVYHNNDGWHGADLNNTEDTTGDKGINVLKSKFNANSDSGLYIRTHGAVVLNTVEASDNIASGAYINNNYGHGKSVTVLAAYGANKFIHNFADNIVIVSNGSVALTNVSGNQSIGNDGIDIDNDSGTGTITLTNVTANFNDNNGFNLYTRGNVTIRNITSMFNYGLGGTYSGLYINTNDVATARVSITTGTLTSNGDYGIQLDMNATKLYTLSGVFYFGNNSDGVGGETNLWVH